MTWRKGNIVFIFGAVFPAAIHFCSFKVRLRTCTLLSLPAIPLLPPVTTHLTRGLPFDMQIDALCSKQTLGANIFHTALSAVTIEDGAALLAPSTTWLTLRKNTPTNLGLQFQLLFSIILSSVFAVVPVGSFLFWFRPATAAGSRRLCLSFASCPPSWRCLMSGSEGSWSRVKSGVVTSLYANAFSYINTQFVKGINILRTDYTNYSLIIHPFFENGL